MGMRPLFLKDGGLSPAFYASAQQCSTKSTIKVFGDWKQEWNVIVEWPSPWLLSDDLNIHLSQFAVEARKVNDEHYPPSMVYHFMSGLLWYMWGKSKLSQLPQQAWHLLSHWMHTFISYTLRVQGDWYTGEASRNHN